MSEAMMEANDEGLMTCGNVASALQEEDLQLREKVGGMG
jgi:hypothetical protein